MWSNCKFTAALSIILEKAIASVLALAKRADKYKDLCLTARSHNVPAQLTTLGKRLANWGEELSKTVEDLTRLCAITRIVD
jgi:adenylosuccinate lyase